MPDRAHVRSGVVIGRFQGERGRIELESGALVSPVVIGFVDGNDEVLPYVEVTNDTSTGQFTVTTSTETVEPTQVVRTTTIRDRTTQELTDEVTQEADAVLVSPGAMRALALATVDLALAQRDGQLAGRTLNQVRTTFRDRVERYFKDDRGLP